MCHFPYLRSKKVKKGSTNSEIHRHLLIAGLLLYLTVCFFVVFTCDGTGDAGDSVHHYLFARYAPNYPALFFDHWAKPLFVLLASPFAQFGFIGIKIFNVLVSALTVYFTIKTCSISGIRNSLLTIAFFVFAPVSFALTFSGLTEPLFALLLILGIYLTIKEKGIIAAIVISFLPFVRSEGLLIIGIFTLYFLMRKQFKFIPLLLVGHVVYSIAGYFVYHDILWVFTKIPYAHVSSVYGHGGLFHFVNELAYLIGIPIYVLMGSGICVLLWKGIRNKVSLELLVLVGLGFLGFFIAHTLFWYLGIFNSMGLKRVFVGVMPLMVISALFGFNFLVDQARRWHKIVFALLMLIIAIFPFTNNHAALHIDQDLRLNSDQRVAIDIAEYILKEEGANHRFQYTHPYLSLVLNVDHFNPSSHIYLSTESVQFAEPGDILIWDNWFGVVESGISREFLDSQDHLRLLHEIREESNGRTIEYAVYERL